MDNNIDLMLEIMYREEVYDEISDSIRSMYLEPDMTEALLDAIYEVLLG